MKEIVNPRRKFHTELECVPEGYSNGVAQDSPLSEDEKTFMIDEAAIYYGKFLDALKVDWRNDPNAMETPKRVAKSFVYDLFKGRYDKAPDITSFPADGYSGLITEVNIPLTSVCSHHIQPIIGRVHVSYIPSPDNGRVIGLSKLNRIVEHFGRRGAIQEQLTTAIHQAVDKVCENNLGVSVMVVADHSCVSCRGIRHKGSSMVTTKMSGNFMTLPEVRQEFLHAVANAPKIPY